MLCLSVISTAFASYIFLKDTYSFEGVKQNLAQRILDQSDISEISNNYDLIKSSEGVEIVASKEFNGELFILYKTQDIYGMAVYKVKPFNRYEFARFSFGDDGLYCIDNFKYSKNGAIESTLAITGLNEEKKISYFIYKINNEPIKVEVDDIYFMHLDLLKYDDTEYRNISDVVFYDKNGNEIMENRN